MRLFSVIFKHCAKIANDRLRHDIALIMLKQSLDFEMVESIKIADKISQAKDCYTLLSLLLIRGAGNIVHYSIGQGILLSDQRVYKVFIFSPELQRES